MGIGDWGLGTGDWGLGTGDWGLGDKVDKVDFNALCPMPYALFPMPKFLSKPQIRSLVGVD
ncbi:hypothetical protein [Nostoc sp. CMAA1605]|uniref:hypothetical protein n=1 Tax=Nostoc sp. CMAA1605 TaxID=2055159 RepID=UPI001F4259FF|nr:hypothetical protein [Nostoc sp. CMAA1605]